MTTVGNRTLLVAFIKKTLLSFSHSSDEDIQRMGRGSVGNNGGNLGFDTGGLR